mgnify:CR=1 FL=1
MGVILTHTQQFYPFLLSFGNRSPEQQKNKDPTIVR